MLLCPKANRKTALLFSASSNTADIFTTQQTGTTTSCSYLSNQVQCVRWVLNCAILLNQYDVVFTKVTTSRDQTTQKHCCYIIFGSDVLELAQDSDAHYCTYNMIMSRINVYICGHKILFSHEMEDFTNLNLKI